MRIQKDVKSNEMSGNCIWLNSSWFFHSCLTFFRSWCHVSRQVPSILYVLYRAIQCRLYPHQIFLPIPVPDYPQNQHRPLRKRLLPHLHGHLSKCVCGTWATSHVLVHQRAPVVLNRALFFKLTPGNILAPAFVRLIRDSFNITHSTSNFTACSASTSSKYHRPC